MYWKLVALRSKHNMSQQDMARLLDISVRSYGMKERAQREFKLEEVYKISKCFKLKIEDIFFDSMFVGSEQRDAEQSSN